MASYVVMQPEGNAGADAEAAVFVRDGFAYIAFFLPAVWLLWHRLWIEAALAIATTLALTALGNVGGFGMAAPLLSLLVSIYAGLEGAALRIAALRRRGWRELGVVVADSQDDAEMRWLIKAGALPEEPEFGRPDFSPAPDASRRADSGPMLGLLLNPGKS
ncbi:DUF2628 domain-containing protein [Mesorhizobium sp. ZC-5]|uniref:DUF2628 domain-containing protein n=1 Tax=Mesorhizobium sp. ZC-5 TaxID=2986066 RepID=UPI0021E77C88|nr:DUF2628 domain-containing protein [Mesorhizobium sp. ZC-5]MCV3239216.1 DUF2628 domain-containing protein [Mesorhizobium sp. ZC-5]